MIKFKKDIVLTSANNVYSTSIDELRLQLRDTKIIARRAAIRWSLNKTGGGSVPN